MQIEIHSNGENPIKRMRSYLKMTQEEFSNAYGIPVRTLQQWESGRRNPPEYVINLLERAVKEDGENR
ncbi:MAG: helix-turn-helix domain-containing protein [Lachnospiraceae bacterium]|nr:helix-turn-helix domain-containing protein [Lachnospiraceae bacterium]